MSRDTNITCGIHVVVVSHISKNVNRVKMRNLPPIFKSLRANINKKKKFKDKPNSMKFLKIKYIFNLFFTMIITSCFHHTPFNSRVY